MKSLFFEKFGNYYSDSWLNSPGTSGLFCLSVAIILSDWKHYKDCNQILVVQHLISSGGFSSKNTYKTWLCAFWAGNNLFQSSETLISIGRTDSNNDENFCSKIAMLKLSAVRIFLCEAGIK